MWANEMKENEENEETFTIEPDNSEITVSWEVLLKNHKMDA